MERKPYIWSELFLGDEDLFQKILRNPETIFVYDIDGILANSAKIVYKRFTEKTGVEALPYKIDRWDYLTELSKDAGLDEDTIKHAEDEWFKSEILGTSQRYLYIGPVVEKTVNYYGADKNFVLTSRNPYLKDSTIDWFAKEFPKIKKENIFIRGSGGIDLVNSAKFKVEKLQMLARKAPWVVFVDDSTDFVKAVLDDGIKNCLVVNIPQGKIMPDFEHERLIVIKRFPDEIQAMYPLMYAIDKALDVAQSH
ncbi:MAG: hypothetical protein NT162_02085 [Candidatus Woesebacteria bacterium]|nr:hypothetical protein [Candidatus Woesebacteria bacterium]